MNNGQQSRLTRNAALNTFMGLNLASYTTDAAMTTIATKMNADSAAAVTASIAAEADNTGYAAQKDLAKLKASNTAAALCDNCQVKLVLLGDLIISQSLNGTYTHYYGAADALCGSRLMAVYNVMETNLALITVDYLTAAELSAFLLEINAFTALTGSTSAVNGGSSVLTKQFATDLKQTNVDVETIKKVGKKYKKLNLVFYNGLMKACKIPAITVRHTTVAYTITDSSTTGVLAGVAGTLSKSKELPVSNVGCVMTYTTVPAGAATASFSKTGYITQIVAIDILQGKMNTSNVSMVPGVMTAEEEVALKITLDASVAAEKAATAALKKAKKKAKTEAAVAAALVAAETVEVAEPAVIAETKETVVGG